MGRAERIAVLGIAALVILSFVVSVAHWSGRWLHNDVWEYLQRGWSIDGLLRPHAGHPAPVNIGLTLLLRDLVGFDSAVQNAVLRGLAWSVFLATFAWSVIRRGGGTMAALLATGLLAVWPLATWQEGWYVSSPLAFAAALVLAVVIAESPQPSAARVAAVSLGVSLLVIFITSGTILGFALVLALLVTGRWRQWWPVIASAPAVYVIWRLVYGFPAADPDFSQLVTALRVWFDLVTAGLATTFAANDIIGVALVVVAAVVVVVGLRRRGPDLTDLMMLFGTGAYLASIVAYRIANDAADPLSTRYQYAVLIMFLAVVVPRVPRLGRGWQSWVTILGVTALLALVIPQHLSTSAQNSRFWEERTGRERSLLATHAGLLNEGVSALPNASTGVQPLRISGLRHLLDTGLSDALTTPDPGRVAEARGWLQVSTQPALAPFVPETCLDETEVTLSRPPGWIVVGGSDGTLELAGADGPAVRHLRGPGTFYVEPLFDEATEQILMTGDICLLPGISVQSS